MSILFARRHRRSTDARRNTMMHHIVREAGKLFRDYGDRECYMVTKSKYIPIAGVVAGTIWTDTADPTGKVRRTKKEVVLFCDQEAYDREHGETDDQ